MGGICSIPKCVVYDCFSHINKQPFFVLNKNALELVPKTYGTSLSFPEDHPFFGPCTGPRQVSSSESFRSSTQVERGLKNDQNPCFFDGFPKMPPTLQG